VGFIFPYRVSLLFVGAVENRQNFPSQLFLLLIERLYNKKFSQHEGYFHAGFIQFHPDAHALCYVLRLVAYGRRYFCTIAIGIRKDHRNIGLTYQSNINYRTSNIGLSIVRYLSDCLNCLFSAIGLSEYRISDWRIRYRIKPYPLSDIGQTKNYQLPSSQTSRITGCLSTLFVNMHKCRIN
jgi:hypothetical protein